MSWLKRGKDEAPQVEPQAEPQVTVVSPAPTADEVREVIRDNVVDPEIGLNVVDIGLIYDVDVTEEKGTASVHVTMTLTTPACPVGPHIISGIQTHVHHAFPQLEAINVHVVWTPPWSPEMMTQEGKDALGFF